MHVACNGVRAHATRMCMCMCMCMYMCMCMCMCMVHVAFTWLSAAAQLYAKYRELSAKGTLQENINNLHAAPVDSGACPRCNWRLPSTTTAPRRPVWLGRRLRARLRTRNCSLGQPQEPRSLPRAQST